MTCQLIILHKTLKTNALWRYKGPLGACATSFTYMRRLGSGFAYILMFTLAKPPRNRAVRALRGGFCARIANIRADLSASRVRGGAPGWFMKYWFFLSAVIVTGMLPLSGCDSPERVEIQQRAPVSGFERSTTQPVSDSERFRLAPAVASAATSASAPQAGGGAMVSSGTATAPNLTYALPAPWREVPATQFRNLNFIADAAGAVECYVSILPGLGGGLLQNANRWRGQMGLPPLSEGEFDALPRKTILGVASPMLALEGAFAGMGGSAPRENYKMLGALVAHQGYGVYVKMTGPADAVEAETSAFDQFLGSLGTVGSAASPAPSKTSGAMLAAAGGLPAGHPPVGGQPALASKLPQTGASSGQGLQWKAPEGWKDAGAKSMRLVTYIPEGAADTECYVTLLSGSAGGLLNNINRWRAQFGNAPITEEALQTLPTVSFLGHSAPVIEVQGPYTDMQGNTVADSGLIAMAWIEDERSAFIKMTGPVAAIAQQKEAFMTFCTSFGWAI